MHPFAAILVFGLLMSAIAFVGGIAAILNEPTLRRMLLPLVAFASGALIGGALFHMLPEAVARLGNGTAVYVWVAVGFLVFLVLEQFLHWHHCHRAVSDHHQPVGVMLLVATGVHHLIGGMSIGALFLSDFRVGLAAWLAAAAHEVPQELGDFGVLVHGGWRPRQALMLNWFFALTFPLGGLVVYSVARTIPVDVLVPFAAGNFLYIGAVDLIPEFKSHCVGRATIGHAAAFVLGLALLLAVRLAAHQ